MASRSGPQRNVLLPQWIHLFHRCWKPLIWTWEVILVGIFVNEVSSFLATKTKTFDLSGTPLGWGVNNPWITLPLLFLLVLLTLLARLASVQKHDTSSASPAMLTSKQRLQIIRGLQQEYTRRLVSSLQGQVTLELHMHERTDVVASSASLVFHQLETGEISPLPPGTSLLQVYDRAQRGLLLLGVAGSGKSTLLLQLACELLQRAEQDSDHPFVIVLHLSTWAKTKLPLPQWLGEQCARIYGIPRALSATWIAQEQVQFLLDGFDEMEAAARTACIEAINTYRQEQVVPLVVCSRSQEYESQPIHLILPTAVEIQPLKSAQIWQVLKQAGKSFAAVRATLRNNVVLGDLLTTPLMLSIILLTYHDKRPKELPQSGSPKEQQQKIFEQYVLHMLQRYQQRRFSSAQTTSSLIWLAQQMQRRQLTDFHLESLQADWLITGHTRIIIYRLFEGLIIGLVFGLGDGLIFGLVFGLGDGLIFGLGIGLVIGLGGGLAFGQNDIRLAEKLAWSWKESKKGLFFGLVFGLFSGVFFGLFSRLFFGLFSEVFFGLSIGLFSVLLSGAVFGLGAGLPEVPLAKDMRLKPNQGIHTSGRNGLGFGLLLFVFFGLVFELFFGPRGGLGIGLFSGVFFGLGFGGASYIRHYVLRWFLLAHSHALPWNAVPFLEEGTRCILLQRVGGGYRFIHPLLQEYFASLSLSVPPVLDGPIPTSSLSRLPKPASRVW